METLTSTSGNDRSEGKKDIGVLTALEYGSEGTIVLDDGDKKSHDPSSDTITMTKKVTYAVENREDLEKWEGIQ